VKNRLAERLKELRNEKDLSQVKLASALNVSPSFIAEIERGRTSVSTDTLLMLADFFAVSTDYLLGRID